MRGAGGNLANIGAEHQQSGATARTVLYLFSDFPQLGVCDTRFPPLSPGSFPDLAPFLEQATDLTQAMPHLLWWCHMLLYLPLVAATYPQRFAKKASVVSCQSSDKPHPVHSPARIA